MSGADGLSAEPLLRKAMQGGRAMEAAPGLDEIRSGSVGDLEALDDEVKALRDPFSIPSS